MLRLKFKKKSGLRGIPSRINIGWRFNTRRCPTYSARNRDCKKRTRKRWPRQTDIYNQQRRHSHVIYVAFEVLLASRQHHRANSLLFLAFWAAATPLAQKETPRGRMRNVQALLGMQGVNTVLSPHGQRTRRRGLIPSGQSSNQLEITSCLEDVNHKVHFI